MWRDVKQAKRKGSLVVVVQSGASGCPAEFPARSPPPHVKGTIRELSKAEKSKAGV